MTDDQKKPEEKALDQEQKPAEKPAEQSEEQKKEEEKPQPVDDAKILAEQEAAAKKQAEEEALKGEVIELPKLKPGMTIRVFQKIKEGEKERIQIFQGIVTAMRGKTVNTKTITVQKNSFGVVVEKIFPLASPLIEKIEVIKIAKVRRSKLYFLKDYTKKLKETLVK